MEFKEDASNIYLIDFSENCQERVFHLIAVIPKDAKVLSLLCYPCPQKDK